jgi:hypothetical protein
MKRIASQIAVAALISTGVGIGTSMPANALPVTSSNSDATGLCTQNVDNTSNVTVNRFGSDCVITFGRVGTTVWQIPTGVTKISALIIAGGGGGGYDVAGGGGAGGLLYYGGETPKTPNGDTLTVTSGNISVAVGDGGAGATTAQLSTYGANGSNSSLTLPSSTVYTAIGGGGGNSRNYGSTAQTGGSGGGGGYGSGSPTAAGSGTGSGVTLQGYAGGRTNSGSSGAGGGGGGAGGAGVNWIDGDVTTNIGTGGVGLSYAISGTATYYAGGGGAGSWNAKGGPGGNGGGGAGGSANAATCRTNCSTDLLAQTGNVGTANTGGGGGGSGNAGSGAPAGKGGSGVAIIRYTANVSTTATISIAAGGFIYRTAKAVTVTTSAAGKVDFRVNGKYIPGCRNVVSSAGNSFTATCNYRAAIHAPVVISALFKPSDAGLSTSTATSAITSVVKRSNTR